MQISKTLLAIIGVILLVGAAAAQTDKHTHEHGSGGVADSKASTESVKPQIAAKDLKARIDKGEKITIIDARHDVGGEMIKGAIHVPSDRLEAWAKSADKNSVIVTYCTCPHDEAADGEVQKLRQMGFMNAYALSGGLDAARAAGFEVIAPADNTSAHK
jgi:rhodanese-related sulfurtransferase